MSESGISNLLQRIAVALVGVPLILWLNAMGGWYFFAFSTILVFVGICEFHRLLSKSFPSPLFLLLLFSALLQLNFLFQRVDGWLLLTGMLLVLLVVELFRTSASKVVVTGSSMTALLYVNMSFGSLFLIRSIEPYGASLVLLLLICIWSTDILAYFGGRSFGRRFFRQKFFERYSPQKTWEGYISGSFGGIAGSVVYLFFNDTLSPVFVLLTGIVTGLFSPLGDLVESMFKREAGVKDSSALIPGHGGVLDRFDTLMFMSPLVYLMLYFFGMLNGV